MEHKKSTEQNDTRQPCKIFFRTRLNLLNADMSFCRKVIWQRENDYLYKCRWNRNLAIPQQEIRKR